MTSLLVCLFLIKLMLMLKFIKGKDLNAFVKSTKK